MARPHILVALERQYALALGNFEVAEHAVETVIGLKAVIAADVRITAEKRALTEKMERITQQIRIQCDPEWEPGHIRPVRPRPKPRARGEVSKATYRVLKAATDPLRTREIVHLVAPQVGLENPDYHQINRLQPAVESALNNRLKDDMVIHDGGTPKRWSIKRIDARRQAQAFASANSRPIL